MMKVIQTRLARVTGTMSEVAVHSGKIDILIQLEKIVERISDEWLQAEALFWISHGNARLGNEKRARELFMQAVKHGAWDEIELDRIESSWNDPASAENFHRESNYIGWHSTKVAETCAWLAILLLHPKPWHLSAGLRLINDIPEEYGEKRSFCIGLIAAAAEKFSPDTSALLELYIASLGIGKDRHMGEVWAVLHARLPYLEKHIGHELIYMIWDNLHEARKDLLQVPSSSIYRENQLDVSG